MTVAAVDGQEVNPKLQAIRDYVAAGYCLIPCRGKIPAIQDWVSAIPGAYGERELAGTNYGVALRAGDLIVDIDPRHFPPGDRPIARLIEAIGAPLDGYVVLSGNGGLHA